jgi:ATP-dependent helicase/DNAse subunit B
MNTETDAKLETIIHSVVNRLYQKEQSLGLDFEDLKCLEIIYKISQQALDSTSQSPLSSPSALPHNLIDLLRAAKGSPNDNSNI